MEPALQVDNLFKRFGDMVAVDRLSFAVQHGEIFGLLGPNGAGKTTTLRIIMGIYAADEGRVQVLGKAPAAVREQVGYLPEDRGLYPRDPLIAVLTYMAELKGLEGSEAKAAAEHWLERVGLSDRSRDKVETLSRGLRQKLQLAAACVHDPPLVIFDEPFQGLDPVNVRAVRQLVDELAGRGRTIILSSHQLNLVQAVCQRILLLHDGRAVLYGDLAEIREQHSGGAVRLVTSAPKDQLPVAASSVESLVLL